MKLILRISLVVSLVAFFVYRITSPGETPYNYFSLLAESFANKTTIVEINAPHLNELIPIANNQYYVPFAPMPAIVMFLPTLFLGTILPQTIFAQITAVGVVFLSILNAYLISKNSKIALASGLLIAFGSGIWFMASVGSSWYFGQLVGIFFLTLAIFLKLKNYNSLFIGLALGAAYLARPHMILSLPFFLYKSTNLRKHFLILIMGILPFLLFNFFYNYTRFGVFYDKGYELIPGVLDEIWYEKGIFHLSYIPRQLKIMLFEMPLVEKEFPYIIPELRGMAFWLAFPAIFLLRKTNWNISNILVGFSGLLVLLPILMHGAPGFTQFGYRYANDILPLLLLPIVSSLQSTNLNYFSKLIIFVSILVNTWGVIMINVLKMYAI